MNLSVLNAKPSPVSTNKKKNQHDTSDSKLTTRESFVYTGTNKKANRDAKENPHKQSNSQEKEEREKRSLVVEENRAKKPVQRPMSFHQLIQARRNAIQPANVDRFLKEQNQNEKWANVSQFLESGTCKKTLRLQ